ncbi:MAG: DUF2157 domain-containing protein [Candidatus Helarchaeota archaeon]|nr:DUF2157 domain-containing protein [Candidatus Helarchaeota archaeon]
MKLTEADLRWAASQGIISTEQAGKLWETLQSRSEVRATFDLANVAYYLGAMIVIGAMAWLMTKGWEQFGGVGIIILALTYAICFSLAGKYLWYNLSLKIPGGLLITMAVCMTPLAIYGIENATGFWPQGNPGTYHDYYIWIKGSWLFMEIGTIIIGLFALKFIRFPFLTAPIAFSLWFMSMDLTPIIFGKNEFAHTERLWVSLVFGLLVIIVTYIVDRRTKDDYAFWGYLFGLMSFWGGLSLMESGSEWGKIAYCLINVALMLIAIFLDRPVFIIFGSLGFFGYLGYLSHSVFKDSMIFPFVLTILGLAIIFLGIKYQRNKRAIELLAISLVPANLLWLIPKERRSQ